MRKSLQLQAAQPNDEEAGNYSDGSDQQHPYKSIVVPNKVITIADSFKNEHSW